MSDAMSSVEIEDVLSSIRRLVSEDLRPAPRLQMATPTPPDLPAQIVSKIVLADKLILTPALRVVRSDPTGPDGPGHSRSGTGAAPDPQPRLHLGPAHMTVKPDMVAKLAQAVDQQSLDWESETGEPGPEPDGLDWSSFTFARKSKAETWAAQKSASARGGAAAVSPDLKTADIGSFPSAKGFGTVERDRFTGDDALTSQDPAATAPEAVEDSFTASAWADAAEAEALADLADRTPPVAEVMPGVAHDADSIFSEEVLRELVRDLLRAELQGDLGERITRNIRKLVRSEIARALAVQSLD